MKDQTRTNADDDKVEEPSNEKGTPERCRHNEQDWLWDVLEREHTECQENEREKVLTRT